MKKTFTILLTTTCAILLILCGVSFFNIKEINDELIKTNSEYISQANIESSNKKTLNELNNCLEELESKLSMNKIKELKEWQETVQKVKSLLER